MLKVVSSFVNLPVNGKRSESLLWTLTLLFPVLMHFRHGVSTVFGLMLLLSIYMLFRQRPRLNSIAIYMLAALILFILVSLLSFGNAEDMENSTRRLEKIANFIFLIPIFMAMVSCKENLVKAFLIGVVIGGIVLLGIAIYQTHILGYGRAAGFYNAIMFGSLAVLVSLALVVSLVFSKIDKIQFLMILFSLLCALIATILSGTRGAWLGLVVTVPLAIGLGLVVKEISRKRLMQVVVLSLGVILIAGALSKDELSHRWQATTTAIDESKPLTDQRSSIGQRLIMWDAAIKIWYQNPVIGTGMGDFHVDFEKMKKSGEVKWADMPRVYSAYAHSTLFEALATTGILGLIALILSTFLLPVVYFTRALKASVNEYDRYASVFGLSFVTAFLIFGLTENWLAHKQLVITFLLLLAIMASRFGARS